MSQEKNSIDLRVSKIVDGSNDQRNFRYEQRPKTIISAQDHDASKLEAVDGFSTKPREHAMMSAIAQNGKTASRIPVVGNLSQVLSSNDVSTQPLAKSSRKSLRMMISGATKIMPIRSILRTPERHEKRRRRIRKVCFQNLDHVRSARMIRIRDWQDPVIQRWHKIMVLPLTYEMWSFPFRLALCTPSTSSIVWYADIACDSFFWFDILVSLGTSLPPLSDQDEPNVKFTSILKHNFLRKIPFELVPSFLYLIATPLCASLMPAACIGGYTLNAQASEISHDSDHDGEALLRSCLSEWPVWIWWASTCARMIPRMHRLLEYFKAMETNLDMSINTLQLFKYSVIVFMTSHWVGCLYFFIAKLQNLNESSWVRRLEEMIPLYNGFTAPSATQYVVCLYRGFSSFTVTYASTIPNNTWEMLFTFLVMVVQIWQLGVILGAIINYTVERDPIAEAHKKFMEDLQHFVEKKQLPPELKERIYRHFEFQYRKAIENQSSHIDLPKSLQIKVANSKFRSVMERSTARGQVFSSCNSQFLNALLTKLRIVFLMPSEEIFKKGDMTRELCFVYRGACTIMNDEKVKRVVHHDAPDSSTILGEIPYFFGVLHGLNCRANADGDVQLLVLSKADGDELFANYPEQLEIIRGNLLANMGLDVAGNLLQARIGDQEEEDPDEVAITESVCEALKSHADETFTALTYAARAGDVEEMQALIRRGANINHLDYDGRGALAMAAVEGNFKVVEVLLQQGVDINSKNRWGQTPLQEAITARQGPVVELLLQWRAHINTESSSGALCSAASTNDMEQLRRLVENKADVNQGDYDNRTPLHLAAAEGHDKAAEYLLDQKADPCANDRWGCTPLQEAVRSGRTLLAELIRTKGGTLPVDVGAMQICSAASKGDVPALQLLHLCGVRSDVGDYDFRCPLHLAAAEARVLAVSFLLVISANPNCTDRWGNTPLDDAYRGGTTYHKYCGRLIYAWGGTLGKTIGNTNAGKAFMAEIDKITMEEVRRLIRRLIEAGYDRRVPTSSSDQQVHTYYETSVKNIVLAHNLRSEIHSAAESLRSGTHQIHSLFQTMQSCLMPICISIDSHPVNQTRRTSETVSLDSSLIYPNSDASGASISAKSTVSNNSLESELRSLMMRSQRQDTSDNADDVDDAPQPLDSDEEAQLHAELDKLLEMQERVEAMGGNQNKYMASVFHRVCLQITDIEGMFLDLSIIFFRASSLKDNDLIPSVTLKEFSMVLDSLNLSSISQSDLEEMFEQGLRHVSFKTETVGSVSVTDHDGLLDSDTLKITDSDESPDDDVKVSLTSLLIGSDIFRLRIMSMVTDEAFCYMKEAFALQNLSDAQVRSLSAGGRLRTVAKGELFCCKPDVNSRSKPKYSAINSVGSVKNRQNAVLAPRVRPMSEYNAQASEMTASGGVVQDPTPNGAGATSEVFATPISNQCVAPFPQGGDGSQSPMAKVGHQADHSASSWFFIVSGSLTVEDDPLQLEQKLYSELGQGNIFGGYKTLTDNRTPFVLKATKGCQLLELPCENLLAFRNEESGELVRRIASHMGEAPLSASISEGPKFENTLMPAEQENRVFHVLVDGSLPETRLQAIKMSFSKLEQVWQEISFGEQVVPLSQFIAFQPYLGEVGSELFKKLFVVQETPEHISKAVYWEIWINFLSSETYGKKDVDSSNQEEQIIVENSESSLAGIDFDVHEEQSQQTPDCFEIFHARFSTARHLKHSFFNDTVIERYEPSFVAITGDLGASLHTSKIKNFLERLFPDFHHQISLHNCQEFLQTFGRDGIKSKQIAFADIRKVLMERSKESSVDGFFIENALNPNSRAYVRWSNVVSAVACLHYVFVPVRLSFKPWESMTDYRALALDLTIDMLTFAHVIVLSNTAYKNARGQWIDNRLKIIRRINISCSIAAFPADWFAYVFGASYEMCNWLRLFKLLLPYEVFVRQNAPVARRSTYQRMIKLSTVLLALLHMAACMWFYIGTRYKEWYPEIAVSWNEINPGLESLSRVSYHNRYGLRQPSKVWDQYLISLYWATVTLTSYGIVGDLLPQNNVEMIYAMCLMVLNITVFSFIIGEVSTVFMIQDEEVTKARAQLGAVESFVRGSHLEDDLRDEIKLHFKATRMHSSTDQAAIFRRMSRSLQVEVSSYTTRGYLDGVPLFQGCSPQLIDAISVLLSEVTFSPEDYLYRISEIAREMFFVIDGTVDEITESEKGEKVDAVVKAGGSIGVLSFFFGMRHLGSARAGKLSGAICLRLSRDEFMDMLKLYPEEEGKIAQSAMKSFEGARSQYGSRRASSHAPSTRTGGSNAVSSGNGKSSSDGGGGCQDDDIDSSEAFTQALGGSGIRQRMAALKRRRENKRIYGVLTAAANGDIGRLKASITGEGDCNITDHFRRTPLHVAAAQGQLDSVRILLAARADADARDRFENTPLNDAVRHHHDEVAELIRERSAGAAISLKGHEIGGLICRAAFDGDLDHVRRLITNRASPSACDYDRRSALHLACCEGHAEMVRFLLEVRADPLARDRFGGAPLDDAVRHGHTHLQAMLCKSGARLTGEKYALKICEAAARGDLDTIRTLMENGVDTAVGDYDGRTALHLAASEGEVSILHYLLEQEPALDVNCVDRVGGTPLEDAVRHGHRVAVMMLEDAGGMRRHEKRLSELVGRYLAHLDPNRIDVLLRSRRGAAAMRLKWLRADGVRQATEEGVEAKALEAIRDNILPTIRTRMQVLQDQFEVLVANILAASPVILSALHMHGSASSVSAASRILAIAKSVSMGSDPAAAAKIATFSGSAGSNPMPGGYADMSPMETTVALLAKLPELSAAVMALREAIEAPLPRCRVVQMCARAFRREAAALRVEVRRTADAARLLRRILRGAQTVFRTRTFRNILRRAMSFSSVCRNISSEKQPLTMPRIRKVGTFLKAKAAFSEAGEQAVRGRVTAADLHDNSDACKEINALSDDKSAGNPPSGGQIKPVVAKQPEGGVARSAQALMHRVSSNAAATHRPRQGLRFAAENATPVVITGVAQRAAATAVSAAPKTPTQPVLQQRAQAPPLLTQERHAAAPPQAPLHFDEDEAADEEAVLEPVESQPVGREYARRGGGGAQRPGRRGRGGGLIANRSRA